ncbi:MAG: 5-formyltetrahydrofolate cyclo-ligase, partial [Oscillospiraceae bacterium]|nr:5-formyltetrahydrofolate cyclo-ligase [Candidatus Equicaccousia limihippi]
KRRREMDPIVKGEKDARVAFKVKKLYQYRACDIIMVYVSTPIEVDTRQIIKNAIKDGKKVAVPRCIPYTRQMQFHYINSVDELKPGAFGVLEPDETFPVVTDFDKTLMLVPAFMFSACGYRLGYGKGYYDRYMSTYTGCAVGICYSEDFKMNMHHGRYDRAVDTIVTDSWIRNSQKIRQKQENTRIYHER